MPKLDYKKKSSKKAEIPKEDILNIVRDNVKKLEEEPTDKKLKEEIVCKFFSKGGYPQCSNCIRHEDTINEHTEWYIEFMKSNPCLEWHEDLQSYSKRDKEISPDKIDYIGLNCESCYLANNCSLFRANSLCAIDWKKSDIPKEPKSILKFLIERQLARVQRGTVIEEVDGGVPDANLSSEMDRLHGLVETLVDLDKDRFSLKIEGEAQNKGGSLLQAIFGGAMNKHSDRSLPEKQPKETIDIDALEVDEDNLEKVKLTRDEDK